MCHLQPRLLTAFVDSSLFLWSTLDRMLLCEFEINETSQMCDILVPNELKNAEHLTVQLGLQ